MSILEAHRSARCSGPPARLRCALGTAALLAALAGAACRGKDTGGSGADDAADGPPAFEPAPLRELTFQSLRLRLRAPENLDASVEGDVLTLSAVGFPPVTIRVERTARASGAGGGGACRDGECSFQRDAPCRRLTCSASAAGDFATVIPAICGSFQSTFVPAAIPVARALSTSGTHADCDETQLANSQSLDPKIAELLPDVEECWRTHADDHPDWRSGEATVRLERVVRDDGRATYELTAVLSGLEGGRDDLQRCLDGAVASLRGHLPVIGNAVCAFRWDHRFALARKPTCAREATPPPDPDAGVDAGPDAEPDAGRPERSRADAGAREVEPESPAGGDEAVGEDAQSDVPAAPDADAAAESDSAPPQDAGGDPASHADADPPPDPLVEDPDDPFADLPPRAPVPATSHQPPATSQPAAPSRAME